MERSELVEWVDHTLETRYDLYRAACEVGRPALARRFLREIRRLETEEAVLSDTPQTEL